MTKQGAVQVFSVLAIAAGLLVSYFPPQTNAQAIWALVGGFLGYAIRDLFADPAAVPAAPLIPANSQTGRALPGMMLLLVVASALAMSACSLLPGNFNKIEEGVAQTVVQSSERTICRDIPVGTWLRLYGTSSDRVKGWQALCFNPITAPLNDATVAAILKVYPGFQQAVEAASAPPGPVTPPNSAPEPAEAVPALGTGIKTP